LRKNSINLLLLLLSLSLFSNDIQKGNKIISNAFTEVPIFVFAYEKTTFLHDLEDTFVRRVYYNSLKQDDFGFYHIIIDEEDYILIPGLYDFEIVSISEINSYDNFDHYIDNSVNLTHLKHEITEPFFDNGIKNAEATSYLDEYSQNGTIKYTVDHIFDQYIQAECQCHDRYWNRSAIPWVEGHPEEGIGEKISLTFNEKNDYIVLLNGYVDLYKRHLFKYNNRLKKIRLSSPNFRTFEIEFDDTVEFTTIFFPNQTDSVELEIIEVYPGEKWNDTCISYIGTGLKYDEDAPYLLREIERFKELTY